VLSCKTYLKRLNVTRQMADNILPAGAALAGTGSAAATAAASPPPSGDADASAAPAAAAGGGSTSTGGGGGGGTYITLFRVPVVLVDEAGVKWTVHYEGTLCRQQRHLRLTAGWPAFIRSQRAAVGDAIVFERRGRERGRLWIRVLRGVGGSDDGEAEAAAARDGLLQVGAGLPGIPGLPAPAGAAPALFAPPLGPARALGGGLLPGGGSPGADPLARGPSMLSRQLH
jgi:hypothetical protein